MAIDSGGGVKFWELRSKTQAGAEGEEQAPSAATEQQVDAKELANDVFDQTHRTKGETKRERFGKGEYRAKLKRDRAVDVDGGRLSIGGESFDITESEAASISLRETNREVISGVWAGINSARATVVTSTKGSGASHAVRWLLDTTEKNHRMVRLKRTDSIEKIAGKISPDAKGNFRVPDGPLTDCIRNGGVFVADGFENADPNLASALISLAKGAKVFINKASGEPIPVHPDFKLVIVNELPAKQTVDDQLKRVPQDLLGVSNQVVATRYTKEDHAALLEEQTGLDKRLALTLAEFHDRLERSDVEFGGGFTLGWTLLQRVGARLSGLDNPSNDAVARALTGVYGARIQDENQRLVFEDLLSEFKLPAKLEASASASQDTTFVQTDRVARVVSRFEEAINAREPVLLEGDRQSGVTRIVEDMANRRGQELATIIGNSGSDPDLLSEMPVFTEDGDLYFRPGRITEALLEGKMLYVDHLDHMPKARQNAIFELARMDKIKVVDPKSGEVVEREVNKDFRLVMSTNTGVDPSRTRPEGSERANVTEIYVPKPDVEELVQFLPAGLSPEVAKTVADFAKALHQEDATLGVTKMQRFRDFAGTVQILSEHMTPQQAARKAAEMIWRPQESAFLAKQPQPPQIEGLYLKLLGLTRKDVDAALKSTGYELVPSVEKHLDAMAIAYLLRRPIFAVGPASSGKTVLGSVFAAILNKSTVRYNYSGSTQTREVMGGIGPTTEDGKTVFKDVPGPAPIAAVENALKIADELNLSREVAVALKSWADYRYRLTDAEGDKDIKLDSAILYATGNPAGSNRGRTELPPTIGDCMFVIPVDAKPTEEKIKIVEKRSKLPTQQITRIAKFYEALEIAVAKGRFKSGVAPITCTERDMIKAAQTAEYLIARDGVTDPEEQRRIVGRETFRLVRDLLESPAERELLFESLVGQYFGKDAPKPDLPREINVVEKKDDSGKSRKFVRIGIGEYPIRESNGNPEMDALVKKLDGMQAPVGPQFELLESLLLSLETNQPVSIVGRTGTGKTMLVEYLAALLEQPVRDQAFHSEMRRDDLFGTLEFTEDGDDVRVKPGPLPQALMKTTADGREQGPVLYYGDEPTTLQNQEREGLNAALEGSEISVPTKPITTIQREDWNPHARIIFTTNGDDVRVNSYSDPEASRLRIIAMPEIEAFEDLLEIAQRDFGVGGAAGDYAAPAATDVQRKKLREELTGLVGNNFNFGKALDDAVAASLDGTAFEWKIEDLNVPELELDAAQGKVIADALNAFNRVQKDAPLRTLLNALLEASPSSAEVARTAARVPNDALSEAVLARAEQSAVVDGLLTSPDEIETSVEIFYELRELQRSVNDGTLSPLTPRILSSFLQLFASLREDMPYEQALGAASEFTLIPRLGPENEKKGVEAIVRRLGEAALEKGDAPVPRLTQRGVYFGETSVPYGRLQPYGVDNERFPWTPARCANVSLLAKAIQFGTGRPLELVDDKNQETMEEIREFARLTGRQVTVIRLSPKLDIEQLIQKLELSKDDSGDLTPQLQKIGQAVRDGHILVFRGSMPSDRFERLNSLLDGRRKIQLPKTNETLKANDQFVPILLRDPDAPRANRYSQAVINRVISPPLSTSNLEMTQEAVNERAAELGAILSTRTGVKSQVALRLAAFHTFLNESMRELFTTGASIGSFVNRDAEAVARRLSWLIERNVVGDELEALHDLVMDIYGDRFEPEADRLVLEGILKRFFGTEGGQLQLDDQLLPSPNLMRLGPWAVQRDPRGPNRAGVPGREAQLPMTEAISDVQQKLFSAFQFDEPVHIQGNSVVANANVDYLARLASSSVIPVECNEQLSREYLFGGFVQNQETGQFEELEGAVWQAQREGATLVIRNANRLPEELLAELSEIAASGQVTKPGEAQTRGFRLVFQTSSSDDRSLPASISSICTKVKVPEITDAMELRELTRNILVGVPGGATIADALVGLQREVTTLMASEILSGRETLKFDSGHLLRAATELAELHRGGASISEAVADVITRLYVRPVRGLASSEAVAGLVEGLEEQLFGTNGILEAEPPPVVDVVEKPILATLKSDYGEVATELTGAVLGNMANACESATTGAQIQELAQRLLQVADTKVLPEVVEARVRSEVDTIEGARTVAEKRELVGKLAAYLGRKGASTESVKDDFLSFVKGALVWDVEARFEVVGRYQEVFAALEKAGSPTSNASLEDIASIFERFTASGTLERVADARKKVSDAIRAYRQRGGEPDEVLDRLYRDVVERWDLVSTSPLFKNHGLLRNELVRLNELLEQLDSASQRSGAGDEVKRVVETLREAGEAIEGIRLAEQSTELRRGIELSVANTENLVQKLKTEIVQAQNLKQAKERYDALSNAFQLVNESIKTDDFLKLDLDKEQISKPVGKGDDDLVAIARERALEEVRLEVEQKRKELIVQVNALQAKVKPTSPADLFEGFDLDSAGLGVGFEKKPRKATAAETAYEDGMAQLERYAVDRVEERAKELLPEVRKEEEQRLQEEFERSLRNQTTQLAARVGRSAGDLKEILEYVVQQADITSKDPTLAAEVTAVGQRLDEAVRSASSFAGQMMKGAATFFKGVARAVTFGAMFARESEAQERPQDLEAAKKQAAVVLQKLGRYIQAEIGELPQFDGIDSHVKRAQQLSDDLLLAENLGDLASRYSKLMNFVRTEDDPVVEDTLKRLLNGLCPGQKLSAILQRIANFSDAAEFLSSQIAARSGITAELAPVLESVVRAAETVRSQPRSEKSYRVCVRALEQAIQKVEEYEQARGRSLTADAGPQLSIEDMLSVALEEMRQLVSSFSEETESGGRLELQRAEVGELLRTLADRPDEGTVDVKPSSGGGSTEAIPRQVELPELNRIQRTVERANRRLEELFGRTRIVRETELKIIDIDFRRSDPLIELAYEEREKDSERQRELRGAIADIAGALTRDATRYLGNLSELKDVLRSELGALERSLDAEALEREGGNLDSLAASLEKIALEGGASYAELRREIGAVVTDLDASASVLQALEQVPSETGIRLEAARDAFRSVQGAETSEDFLRRAQRWAADTLESVRKVQQEIEDLQLAKPEDGDRSPREALEQLVSAVDALASNKEKIGSWSRASLLANVSQRLSSLAAVFPEDAKDVGEQARKASEAAATEQYLLAEGVQGERSFSEIYDTTFEVLETLLDAKSLNGEVVEKTEGLANAIRDLLALQGADDQALLDAINRSVERIVDLTEIAKGRRLRSALVSLSESHEVLREVVLGRQLADLNGRVNRAVEEDLERIRSNRIELQEATDAFVDFDPVASKGKSSDDLSAELQAVTARAAAELKGPAAVVLAKELLRLRDRLTELTKEGGQQAARADNLRKQFEAFFIGADALLNEAPDASERLADLIGAFAERVEDLGSKSLVSLGQLEPVQEQGALLLGLLNAERTEVAEKLADAEAVFRADENVTLPDRGGASYAGIGDVVTVESRARTIMDAARLGEVNVGRRDGENLRGQPYGERKATATGSAGGEAAELGGDVKGPGQQLQSAVADSITTQKSVDAAERGEVLTELNRPDIPEGVFDPRGEKLNPIELGAGQIDGVIDRIRKEIAEAKLKAVDDAVNQVPRNEFEQFAVDQADLVNKLSNTLRQYPNTEIVVCVDVSGSTKSNGPEGGSTIIQQEKGALGVVMAAVQNGESNCSVIKFNSAASVVKPMQMELDGNTANNVFQNVGFPSGGTDMISPMELALGQFTDKANNKLILMLTDAQVGGAAPVRQKIETCRAQGVGVAVMGFGAAQNVNAVAGQFGLPVRSYAGAVEGASDLLSRAIVDNAGRFKGNVQANADGIGVSDNQAALSAAPSDGMVQGIELGLSRPISDDPPQVLGSRGPRRQMYNLVNPQRYSNALKMLQASQTDARREGTYKEALAQVRRLSQQQRSDGLLEATKTAFMESLPKTTTTEVARRQLSGPYIDEDRIAEFLFAKRRGKVIQDIFKKVLPKDDMAVDVVLQIDESTSMDDERFRQALEGLFLAGDAIKAINPRNRVAVVGLSDKTRLHAGFEQEWNDELKAHILHQAKNEYPATDDERAGLESLGLLNMIGAESGMVMSFTDGQGMPGTFEVLDQAKKDGIAFLNVGIGPRSKGVLNFGSQGLYVKALQLFPQELSDSLNTVWQEAGGA